VNETRCFVVATDETGRYDGAVEKALDLAAQQGARVILYDTTAHGSVFSNPRPNVWAGEGEREEYDRPLDPVQLEHLGRHTFALQVQHARERGIDAYGWLPDKSGGNALADYAAQQHANVVLLPEGLDVPDIEDAESRAGLTVERV